MFQDDKGNCLNIGKLEFITKSGKKPRSFIEHVNPVDVKHTLLLLVNLFLPGKEDSLLQDNSMKSIKKTAIDEGVFVHSNSIGKVRLQYVTCNFIFFSN